MGNYISDQLAQFLRSILLGGVLGLFYDLLRPLHALGGKLWGGLLDILVSLIAMSSVFFFVMAGDGELRLFILLGVLGGAVLFFCLLSRLLRPLWDFWFRILMAPVTLVGKIFKKLYHLCKKLFSFLQSWFTIMFTQLTQHRGRQSRAQEGDEEMGKAPQQQKPQKAQKKRPSSKLTGLILIALLLGISVQLYYMWGQLQSAQAEETMYAQRLKELEERNAQLEEDLSNSDSQELIENIARDDLGMASPGEKIFRYGS